MEGISENINIIEKAIFRLNRKKEELIKKFWSNIICSLEKKRDDGWILFVFKSHDKNTEARERDIIRFYLIEPNMYYKYVHKFIYANFWHMSIGGNQDLIERSEDFVKFELMFFGPSKFYGGINYHILEPYELRELFPDIFQKFY